MDRVTEKDRCDEIGQVRDTKAVDDGIDVVVSNTRREGVGGSVVVVDRVVYREAKGCEM